MKNLRLQAPLLIIALVGMFVGAATMSQSEGFTLQNPVIEVNFPDPFILKVEDTYYAYSTNSNSRNVPTATSTDLVHWTLGRDALPIQRR